MSDRKFAGKVVIATGSSSGIGQGVALLFGQQGANVTIHGLDLDEVKETEKLMLDAGVSSSNILLVAGDVRDPKTSENLITKTVQKWGKLDVLVNNAG
uniref:SDR family NAD(P)-dependent oxidoreductase n=1 Tax=Steinernema glaseri TaxID=37863 RepID=A0A1I7ZJS6_9BILA